MTISPVFIKPLNAYGSAIEPASQHPGRTYIPDGDGPRAAAPHKSIHCVAKIDSDIGIQCLHHFQWSNGVSVVRTRRQMNLRRPGAAHPHSLRLPHWGLGWETIEHKLFALPDPAAGAASFRYSCWATCRALLSYPPISDRQGQNVDGRVTTDCGNAQALPVKVARAPAVVVTDLVLIVQLPKDRMDVHIRWAVLP